MVNPEDEEVKKRVRKQFEDEVFDHLNGEEVISFCKNCCGIIWSPLTRDKAFCKRCGTLNTISKEEREEDRERYIKIEKKSLRKMIVLEVIVTLFFLTFFIISETRGTFRTLTTDQTIFCFVIFWLTNSFLPCNAIKHRIDKIKELSSIKIQ